MTAIAKAAALEPEADSRVILALPKGRILSECGPLLAHAGIVPAPTMPTRTAAGCAFPPTIRASTWCACARSMSPPSSRSARRRSAFAAADVLMEFDYPEIYAPLDLGIGGCRISVAEPRETAGSDDPRDMVAGAGRDQISEHRPPALRRPRHPGRDRASERCDGTRPRPGAVRG